jgi:hypothetical protein
MKAIAIGTLLILAVVASPASARLGETLEECKKRYGFLSPMTQKIGDHAVRREFRNRDFMLTSVTFLDGKAASIRFTKDVGSLQKSHFSSGEISELLEANGSGREWWLKSREETPARPYVTRFGYRWFVHWSGPFYGDEEWVLEDGAASATYDKGTSNSYKSSLTVETKEWGEYEQGLRGASRGKRFKSF